MGSICKPRACPAAAGLQKSAQGFNPGNPQNKRFALKLKGREMRAPDEARTYCRAKIRVRNWDLRQLTIGLRFRLLGRSDIRSGAPSAPPTRRTGVFP